MRCFLPLVLLFSAAPILASEGCNVDWSGIWQLSAEGRPFALVAVMRGEHNVGLRSEITRYEKIRTAASVVELEGEVTTKAYDRTFCRGNILELFDTQKDGSETGIRFTSHAPGDISADFSDWPDSMQPLAMRVSKAETNAELHPLATALSLGLDRRGQRTEGSNAELAKMFTEDQTIRDEISQRGGWAKVKDDKAFLVRWETEDAARLARTQKLLEAGTIKSGLDFYRAAFIYQHGKRPEDYLKAHHLAVIAISKGYDARWISAATLDRYLQATGRKQVYGTQSRANEVGEYVREPVEFGIISDAERAELNVPALTDEK